jgi:hypothetical protein
MHIFKVGIVVALALVATTPAFADRHGHYYHSSDGSWVHSPYHTHHHVRGEMAVCRDGTHSVS